MNAPTRDFERPLIVAALLWIGIVFLGYVIYPAYDGRCSMTPQGWRCRP